MRHIKRAGKDATAIAEVFSVDSMVKQPSRATASHIVSTCIAYAVRVQLAGTEAESISALTLLSTIVPQCFVQPVLHVSGENQLELHRLVLAGTEASTVDDLILIYSMVRQPGKTTTAHNMLTEIAAQNVQWESCRHRGKDH